MDHPESCSSYWSWGIQSSLHAKQATERLTSTTRSERKDLGLLLEIKKQLQLSVRPLQLCAGYQGLRAVKRLLLPFIFHLSSFIIPPQTQSMATEVSMDDHVALFRQKVDATFKDGVEPSSRQFLSNTSWFLWTQFFSTTSSSKIPPLCLQICSGGPLVGPRMI